MSQTLDVKACAKDLIGFVLAFCTVLLGKGGSVKASKNFHGILIGFMIERCEFGMNFGRLGKKKGNLKVK